MTASTSGGEGRGGRWWLTGRGWAPGRSRAGAGWSAAGWGVALAMLMARGAAAQELTVCPGDTQGALDAVVTVPVLIDSPETATDSIQAFGFELLFDGTVLDVVETLPSGLTDDWSALSGMTLEPGRHRVGGFSGAGTPIDLATIASPDTLAYIRLLVELAVAQSEYSLSEFLDDLAGTPDCTGSFSATNPVDTGTWGRIKRLYVRER